MVVVHGSGPEPALTVAATVIKATVGVLLLVVMDDFNGAARRVEKAKAVPPGSDKSFAVLPERHTAGLLRRFPAFRLTAGRLVPPDRFSLDVEPIERLLDGAPDWPFTEFVTAFDHARHLNHGAGPYPAKRGSGRPVAPVPVMAKTPPACGCLAKSSSLKKILAQVR